jgi:predicted dehydrogenase
MKIGMIGLKGHEGVVLSGARSLGDCQIVAVADDNQEVRERFVRREKMADGAELYADWRHLIEHTMMDVCCVCDTTGERAEQLIALAKRGVHVVTEKPLTSSLADLARVRAAFDQSPSQLTMLLTMRHDPKYSTLRRIVQEGTIGDVCLATSQKSYRLGERPEWQKSRALLGGTIPFIGIHAIDLLQWTTGLDFTHVAAFHGNLGTPSFKETEDQASVLLRYANGASATARLDYLRPDTAPTHGDDRLRIAGSKGVIEAIGVEDELVLLTDDAPPQRIKPEPTSNFFVEFVEALREGRPSRVPAEDCFYISEVVLTARDAADNRQMLELKPRPASKRA